MATIGRTVVRYRDVAGIRRRSIGTITGPASYEDNTGDVINANELGLGIIEDFIMPSIVADSGGINNRIVSVTIATDGLSVSIRYFTALATEVADAVDLSAYVTRFEAVGR